MKKNYQAACSNIYEQFQLPSFFIHSYNMCHCSALNKLKKNKVGSIDTRRVCGLG